MSWDHFEFFAVLLEIVGDATVLATLGSWYSAVFATSRSRFRVSFNQRAIHTGLKLAVSLSNYNNYYIITFFVTEIVSQHEYF